MSENRVLVRTFKPQATVNQFAAIAWFYDLWALLTENKAVQRALAMAHVHDNSSVLEVAVGTGRLFSEIVKRNPNGKNEGIDISPAMLAHAHKRLQKFPSNAYQLKPGSAYDLHYKDNTFDFLFNTYMSTFITS